MKDIFLSMYPLVTGFIAFLVTVIILFISISSFAQIANGDFEQWSVDSNGIEYLAGWHTNNYPGSVSAEKAPTAIEGAYSLQLSSNAPGIEGPVSGFTRSTFTLSSTHNLLTALIQIDSVEDGYVGIRLIEFVGDNFYEHIDWKQTEPTDGIIAIELPFTLITGDSLRLQLTAANSSGPVQTFGFSSFIIDQIEFHITTNLNDATPIGNEQCFYTYPNPNFGKVNIVPHSAFSADSPIIYKVISITGQVMMTGSIQPTDTQLSLSHLPAGSYYIRLLNSTMDCSSNLIIVNRD